MVLEEIMATVATALDILGFAGLPAIQLGFNQSRHKRDSTYKDFTLQSQLLLKAESLLPSVSPAKWILHLEVISHTVPF